MAAEEPIPPVHDISWIWYRGQKYELFMPRRRFGRWAWVAHLDTGQTFSGKAFRQRTAIANAKRAIKKSLKGRGQQSEIR